METRDGHEVAAVFGANPLAVLARGLVNGVVRWHRRNALYREMMGVDDRVLADIGASRADIPDLVSRAYRDTVEAKRAC